MNCTTFEYTGHATRRLFERNFEADDMETAVRNGEAITDYPDEKPYPCVLLLSFIRFRPIHVVVAFNAQTEVCLIVTVYEPDPAIWSTDFRTKRKPTP